MAPFLPLCDIGQFHSFLWMSKAADGLLLRLFFFFVLFVCFFLFLLCFVLFVFLSEVIFVAIVELLRAILELSISVEFLAARFTITIVGLGVFKQENLIFYILVIYFAEYPLRVIA